jgi:shikimate kinase
VQHARGQDALHEIEDRLLREALGSEAPAVLAAAASVVLKPDALAGALSVWLRAGADWEQRNIERSGQHHRPLPADAATFLTQLSAARESLYAKAADIAIDVASEAQATCDRVLDAIAGRIA